MADGDAFAKVLHCALQNRGKLLKRMCGDEFHEEIDEAQKNVPPMYSGPIEEQIGDRSSEAADQPQEQDSALETDSGTGEHHDEKTQLPGVIPIPHVPQPPSLPRRIVIQKVRKTPGKPQDARLVVDGARCERMAAAFEEMDTPRRWPLYVGHITGTDAPGVDWVSFNTDEDRRFFETEEPRNWNRVARFIEVKGRSSATAKIELKGNELKAARNYKDRYYIYRFYEVTDGEFFVSILQDPVAAEDAKTTIIEFDLERAKTTQRYKFDMVEETNDPTCEEEQPVEIAP